MSDHLQDLLESGSDFDLWKAVAQGAFKKRYDEDGSNVTKIQRTLVDVWVASGVIGNGGIRVQDPEADSMDEWEDAYEALEMWEAAKAIREAAKIRPSDDDEISEELEDQLEGLETQFYAADEEVEERAAEMIRDNPAEAALEEPRADAAHRR